MSPESAATLTCHLITPKPLQDDSLPFIVAGSVYEEPHFDTGPLSIDAGENRYLYFILRLPSPAQISLFFQKGRAEKFDDKRMGMIREPLYREGTQAYRLDLRSIPNWDGTITKLRLQLEGMMKGAEFDLGGLAVSTALFDRIQSPSRRDTYSVSPVELIGPYKGERMVACSRAVLSIDERVPTAGLSTYIDQPKNATTFMINSTTSYDPQRQIALAKFVASVAVDGQLISVGEAAKVRVTPEPGRLTADYVLSGVNVHVEALPLRDVCDTAEAEGACLYKIATTPPVSAVVDCGGMETMTVWDRGAWLREVAVGRPQNRVETRGPVAILRDSDVSRVVALRASGPLTVTISNSHPHARASFSGGQGWVLAAFARDAGRAVTLAETNVLAGERSTEDFYGDLLGRIRLSTPEPVMNEAFRAAVLNMDYAWVKPYGCTESLHHWWALWQQYSTLVFDWIGLEDRSRECIESHAARQYRSGNVPYLLYYGERHEDFGGNNPTFMWQVQHYLKSTNDKSLASRIAPNVRRVVDAFYRKEDALDDGIPGFGVQILTQEDYVATPREGTSPAVCGVEMWRTLSLVERMVGSPGAAQEYEARAKTAASRLLSTLWQTDLGRPAYSRDDLGCVRPDGQYHTLVLPVVYGLLGPLDAWTSIRHLRDRLTGPSGEIYYSNNFPNHMSGVKSCPYGPTWGMQAGAYMQPWGTWGLNRVGLRNEAYRSLLLAAKWAMMFPKLGAWEESSTELTPAYFVNSAANYALGVIEALFGLELDLPAETLKIQPAFPDTWSEASISLAKAKAKYQRRGDVLTYSVSTWQPLKRRVRWAAPVSTVRSVEVNGQRVDFSVEPGVNCIWVDFATPALAETEISIHIVPIDWSVGYPQSIAEGQRMEVTARGCQFIAFDDPCDVAAGVELDRERTSLAIAPGRLDHWLRFGRLGQLNFSRRSAFLKCSAQGQTFWAALDFALLPPFEAAPGPDLVRRDQGYDLLITLRNNTEERLQGNGLVAWAGQHIPCAMDVPARSDSVLRVLTSSESLSALMPGDNHAQLRLPNGATLQIHCPVVRPFMENSPMLGQVTEATLHIALPAESLVEDSQWKEFAAFPAFWQSPYNAFPLPLEDVRGRAALSCEAIPGVMFPLRPDRKLALASRRLGLPSIRIDVKRELRKIFLVALAFVENHDVFTECALVKVTCEARPDEPPFDTTEEPTEWTKTRYEKVVFSRSLTMPGDLDSFFSEYYAGSQATARQERATRYGLLSRLDALSADWPEGVPLASPYGLFAMLGPPPRDGRPEGEFRSFPQPQYWARCPTIRTKSATFNVVEIDLSRSRRVLGIELESPLQDAAMGLVSVVGLVSEIVGSMTQVANLKASR